jgi:tripeptide aminopeptidase
MLNKKQILNTFLELVKIDSPSGQEESVAGYITGYLKKIKVNAWRDKYGNVMAKIPGTGPALLLNAHMDTVEPGRNIKPRINGDIVRSGGDTILAADDKAGIAGILEAASYLVKNKFKHAPLELVFTCDEETGLTGAGNLDYKRLAAKKGLVVDGNGPLGQIIVGAPFIYGIDIKIIGRAAHSGVEPEKGINALQIAARAINELKLGRISRITTNNIGLIQGGSAVNAVPETVILKAEARSHILAEAQLQVDLINKAFKKHVRRFGAKLAFKSKLLCYGYSYPLNDKFIKEIAAVNKKLGIKTVYKNSGGASDGNVFTGKKLKTICISYGGANNHTVRETIRASEILKLTEFIIHFAAARQ